MYVKVIDYHSSQAAQKFDESLRDTGFAVLKNHPILYNLVEPVYQAWEKFFKDDSKIDYLFNPNEIENDLPEGMGNSIQLLFQEMTRFGEEILRWVEKALPKVILDTLSMPLHQMIHKSDTSVLRILPYPSLLETDQENAVRSAEHEDIDLLTILPAVTTSGLQVLDSKGNGHEILCDPGMLVFNAGDMLQEATKGYYKSTTHRVVNPIGELAQQSRYSLPLFLQPQKGVKLSEVHTAESYFAERFRENGLKPAA